MTTARLLPEIDLARIAPRSPERKRLALEAFYLRKPPRISYEPVRQHLADLLDIQTPFFGRGPKPPWEEIKAAIARRSRAGTERELNLAVGDALYHFALDHDVTGRRHDFYPLAIGAAAKVSYWHPVVIALDGRVVVPFVDPRRGQRLDEAGRRFVFSAMHERIRALDPDFADVGLLIIQLDPAEDGRRVPRLHFDAGVELWSVDELDGMVAETYAIWREVQADQGLRARRRTGGHGGLM